MSSLPRAVKMTVINVVTPGFSYISAASRQYRNGHRRAKWSLYVNWDGDNKIDMIQCWLDDEADHRDIIDCKEIYINNLLFKIGGDKSPLAALTKGQNINAHHFKIGRHPDVERVLAPPRRKPPKSAMKKC